MDKKIIVILFAVIAVSVFIGAIPGTGIASEPSNIPTTTELSDEIQIEELQQRVYDQGYNYTVAENWVTRLSPEDREAICGYKHVKAPKENVSENIRFVSVVPKAKAETEKFEQPPSYDAMALGYVTPVKDQGACGSCWIFGATADFESSVAIGESNLLDFSEQEVGDCNIWSRAGGYNFCNGGIELMTTNYFTKYGSANESCHPYAATPQTCQNCSLLKNVDNWRMITGSNGGSQITTIKNAILAYGPVYSTIYASGPGFGSYSGGVYEYWGTESPNHAIEIIGWDDSLPHSHGTGAWMIKNSWGTDWGASGPYPGCAWVAYGAANLGDSTSAVSGYKTPDDVIFYHDECGWMWWCYGYNAITAYGAVRFTPSQDLTLTAVDFWAVDANMQYEIKIFDTLNTYPIYYSFSNQRGTTQTGYTNEQGYYSIPLDTPVELVSGDDFIVQVKLTTTGYGYPIPIDYCTEPWLPDWSGIATFSEESYCSSDGTQFTKPSPYDVGIRARAQEAPTPTITTITINNTSAPSGGNTTTSVMMNITEPTGLGAATINLTYNQSVCVVTDVIKGPSSFDSFTSSHNYTNTSGYVRMVGFQTGTTGVGPGIIKFADVTLKAVGNVGEESSLNLSVETLKNNTGSPIPYTVLSGIFKIEVAPTAANPVRYMPGSVEAGADFTVTVTWTAPSDNFNAIGLNDNANATVNMTVSGNTGWCSPTANNVNPVNNTIEYLWFGPYINGTSFTAVYSVHVPIYVPEGNYTFDGYLEYYIGGEGPFIEEVTGDSVIKVIKGLPINGLTGEVKCSILPNVTITLYNKTTGNMIAETTSDTNGNYTLTAPYSGDYKVTAGKEGFKNVTREISTTEEATYTLNFRGEYGLIPEDPSMSYVLECVNHWLYPPEDCGLTMAKVLEVVNAWLY